MHKNHYLCGDYHPRFAVRTSMSDYREQDNLANIPLYAISTLQITSHEQEIFAPVLDSVHTEI